MMTEFPETRSTLLAQLRLPDNREAWEQFVLIYSPLIYRMARKRGMQDADAQDLAQNVLMRVAGAIDQWEKTDPTTRFRHWLRRVAKNAIITALTKSPKDAAAGGTDMQQLLSEQPETAMAIEQELALEYLREQYHRAAAIVQTDVTAETWRAFELSVIDGKPCDEVAVLIGKSTGTVYAARSRVMRRLHDQVQRLEEGER
jgi:RNA polymerase sigma-70 factor (ECF subfamily)